MTKLKPILVILLLPLATAVFLGQQVNQAATRPLAAAPRHVLLMGSPADVQLVAGPFLADGSLQLNRIYPSPERYLLEAPTLYYPSGTPPDLALHLYEITAPPATAIAVFEALMAAAPPQNVLVEAESLAWLSYLPGQLLVSGACSSISLVMEMVPGLDQPLVAELEPLPGGDCGDNPQIRRYRILDGSQVTEKIGMIQAISNTVVAQPNHLIAGASRDYIAGSPLGPIAPGAAPRQPLPQPFTGQGVRLAVFDSSPFALTPGSQMITTFQGVSVTVSYPLTLPGDLPIGPRPLAGHGTFVTHAILDLAPGGDFHLLRVLNDTAVGDEFTWYHAMSHLIGQTRPISQTLAGMVFNYSFGLEVTPTVNLTATAAMSLAVTAVNGQDVAQVAAAGNDSAFAGSPLSMTWPARHQHVMGITAVIWDDSGLACYANQGEVAIWGGGVPRGSSCTIDLVDACVTGQHPEYCVIGWDPASTTGYAYGLGTSYAAPQVAALAAQAIEEHGNGPGNWPDPDAVQTAVYNLVTGNPDPAHIQVGVIGNPYPEVGPQVIYLPLMRRR